MSPYPVHFSVARPATFSRSQLLVRFVALIVLGMVGLTYAAVFVVAYLALPTFAAIRISSVGPEAYADDDGPWIIKALRWFGAACAWLGLCAERAPAHVAEEIVTFTIDTPAGDRSSGSAIGRVFTGLPSALVLMVLAWIGAFVWLWAALSILIHERVGPHAFGYLVGLQRWSVRLLAYQASLVDDYPPFSFSDPTPDLPRAKAAA